MSGVWAAAAAGVLACAVAWSAGCAGPERETPPDVDGNDPGVIIANPFPPTELRVHPLTRIVTDPQRGSREVEAHVELIDRFGHSVKALGTFNFSLYRTGGVGDPTEQLRHWSVDLSTGEANARPYDMVTRTYRLVLAGVPDEPRDARGLLLVARLTLLDGRTISSTHRF